MLAVPAPAASMTIVSGGARWSRLQHQSSQGPVVGKSDRVDGVQVHAFYRSPGWIIHLRKFLRPAKCRRRRTCNRRADRNGETGGRSFENAIKKRSVQISFLRGGRFLRTSLRNDCHHLCGWPFLPPSVLTI